MKLRHMSNRKSHKILSAKKPHLLPSPATWYSFLLFLTHSSSQFCQLTYVFSYSSSYHLLPIGASPMATNTIPSSIVFYCMRSTKFCHTRCSVNQPMTGMARRLNGVRVSNIQRKWCVMLEKETLRKKSDARRVFLTARSSNNEDEEDNDGTSDSGSIISGLLPYVVAATGVAALVNPSTFSWVSKDLYAPALGGIMLSIGIKLSLQDFAIAFNRPIPLTIGYLAQYMIKPMLGMVIARVFRIPPMFYAGFILTCCVAGAQLSSYASFLSKGDVALSILLTSTTTITSAIVTPLLTGFLIGSVVPVDAIAMSKSILQVVLIPVGIGLGLNTYAKPVVDVIKSVMPILAMICTSLCIGSPLALNRSQILTRQGFNLLLPILSFHLLAFFFGYWFSKIPFCRQEEDVCRTISLCTGMQSSTLAGLLATQFLGSSQAVPAACSVVAMAIMGLYLASFWGNGYRIRDIPTEQPV